MKKEQDSVGAQISAATKENEARLTKVKADGDAAVAKVSSESTQEVSALREKKLGQAKVDLTAANEVSKPWGGAGDNMAPSMPCSMAQKS